MKNILLTVAIFCFILTNSISNAQNKIPYSAEQILEKCIQFHDPDGKWENYSGALKLINSCPGGFTAGTEIIEINVPEDYYKDTWIKGNITIVKEVKDGKIRVTFNGESATDEQIKDFGLNDENVRGAKTWHYYHFGHLMHFKNTGSILQEKVTEENFRGTPCYVITFIGDEKNVSYPFWAGKWQFKINKESFALCGVYTNALMPEGWTDVFEGVLEINGIKIPRVRTYYTKTGDELVYVDLFMNADDNYLLPEKYQTHSNTTGSTIGLKSTHLLKLENEEALNKLEMPIKEINDVLAEMGYPDCGYVIYKVNDDYESDYTHIMEGWWLSKENYDETHNHPKYKETFEKYRDLFVTAMEGQEYFRVEKMMPKLY